MIQELNLYCFEATSYHGNNYYVCAESEQAAYSAVCAHITENELGKIHIERLNDKEFYTITKLSPLSVAWSKNE